MSAKKVEITVSNKTLLRIVALLLGSILLINFVRSVSHILEIIFLAAFLSLALNPAISWIVRQLHIKSRVAATAIAYVVVIVVLVVFSMIVITPLIRQTVVFVKDAPTTVQNLKYDNSSVGAFIRRNHLEQQVDGLSKNIKERTKHLQQPVVENASRVGSALITILTLFVLVFMMLVEGPKWLHHYWTWHPAKYKERHRKLALRMYEIVTGYVIGQLVLALLGALVTMVILVVTSTLLHVSVNAVALAGIVFVTGLIPMIGHIIGGAVVVLACAFVSIPLAIIVGICILIHQQVENVTLQPYIQAKYNELTPLAVFIAALIGIGFAGLLGAFVAIPLVGCLRLVLKDYLSEKETA